MKPTPKLFAFYFVTAFASGAAGFYLLKLLMPNRDVFGALYRMFLYHENHPLPYIAVVALIYAVVATIAVTKWHHFAGWKRHILIVAIIIVSITIASIPGGMLWVIHDMIAGFIPSYERSISYLFWGALTGLQIGWLIVGASLPYSLFGTAVGYIITNRGFEKKKKPNQTPEPTPTAAPTRADARVAPWPS
jgi:hypothetical protein